MDRNMEYKNWTRPQIRAKVFQQAAIIQSVLARTYDMSPFVLKENPEWVQFFSSDDKLILTVAFNFWRFHPENASMYSDLLSDVGRLMKVLWSMRLTQTHENSDNVAVSV